MPALYAGEPIDVVIPCHAKDSRTLELAIEGIRKYGIDVRRIITVSAAPLTSKAEWFDEARYPFSKQDMLDILFGDDQVQKDAYAGSPDNRLGWIYQQLLKLYAPFVIPGISNNVLILDSDTIFLKSVSFFDDAGNALFNPGVEYFLPYFEHMARLLPGLKRVYTQHSGISHHMLFQLSILEDFFKDIREVHGTEPWQALMKCIDRRHLYGSGISEYELYFNYVFARNYKAKIRKLKYRDMAFNKRDIAASKKAGFNYVSCHAYMM